MVGYAGNAAEQVLVGAAMPRAVSQRFADFDELAERIVDFEAEYVRFERGDVCAHVTRVALDRLLLLRGEGDLPHFGVQAAFPTGALLFLTGANDEVVWNGQRADAHTLVRYEPGALHVGYTRGRMTWAAVLCPPTLLEQHAWTMGLEPGSGGSQRLAPDPGLVEGLRCAVHHSFALAESAPSALELPELRRTLEQAVLTAAVRATHPASGHRTNATSHRRAVSRAFEVLEARPGDPIYLVDLCRAARVSERTLRNAFQSLYGVSPIRYLQLRRLEQARQALRHAAPGIERVSDIALRFGFANLGRFAVEFRRLYGESPSELLRRPPPLRGT